MNRSRRRKLRRTLLISPKVLGCQLPLAPCHPQRPRYSAKWLPLVPLLMAGSAEAQQVGLALDEVIVTAQKREQSLQEVPISVQALSTLKLTELNVKKFDDYANLLPSVSFVNVRPGFAQVYMRGVASAGDGDANHSGSLPLVGTYLDEQPVTTIQGALDIHLYDIARVEALAGPQGTLYGASSEAGTIKIVTNKPDPSGFSAGYNGEIATISGGGNGFLTEGFVNVPLTDNATIRLVGWVEADGGFIDNVRVQRTFPSTVSDGSPDPGITTDNAASVKDNYNTVNTYGARAALRIDLNDNWTVTPGVMFQKQTTEGLFGADNTLGKFKVGHLYPENSEDQWLQAALTVAGRIGSFDMLYSATYLDRHVDSNSDYADYSYWYDVAYLAEGTNFSSYFYNDAGESIDFSQYIRGTDLYKKYSQELRFATPQEYRLRALLGAFWQRQEHNIEQNYLIDDLASSLSVTGRSDTIWLTKQDRVDQDYAVFGEVYFDITDKLTGTLGMRVYKTENSLEGYFGFGAGYSSSGNSGEALCENQNGGVPVADLPDFQGAPCKNLDASTDDSDAIYKGNLAYKITENALVYATYSEGFRPGGLNRRGSVPPYKPDFLTNYELGWKTSWVDDRLRFNGAVFHEIWENFQYSVLGANGLTEITNSAEAEIDGLEMDLNWVLAEGWGISAGVAFIDAKLTQPYCANLLNGEVVTSDPCLLADGSTTPAAAPTGTKLPVTPDLKANLTSRYEFGLGSLRAHVQGALVYVGERESDLRIEERSIIGALPAFTLVNFALGVGRDDWNAELLITNAFNEYAEYSRYAECVESKCGAQSYSVVAPPRTFGIRFSQGF